MVICSALAGSSTAVGIQGAVEVVNKPRLGVKQFLQESAVMIVDTVRAAAGSYAKIKHASYRSPQPRSSMEIMRSRPIAARRRHVVALGASTGGTEALRVILAAMPSEVPGIMIVQHICLKALPRHSRNGSTRLA